MDSTVYMQEYLSNFSKAIQSIDSKDINRIVKSMYLSIDYTPPDKIYLNKDRFITALKSLTFRELQVYCLYFINRYSISKIALVLGGQHLTVRNNIFKLVNTFIRNDTFVFIKDNPLETPLSLYLLYGLLDTPASAVKGLDTELFEGSYELCLRDFIDNDSINVYMLQFIVKALYAHCIRICYESNYEYSDYLKNDFITLIEKLKYKKLICYDWLYSNKVYDLYDKEFLNLSIASLKLQSNAFYALFKTGHITVGDIVLYPKEILLNVNTVGKFCISNVFSLIEEVSGVPTMMLLNDSMFIKR